MHEDDDGCTSMKRRFGMIRSRLASPRQARAGKRAKSLKGDGRSDQ